MTFENVAYLFDTTMLGIGEHSVYGVLSFVGNTLYLPAYAKEAIEKYDFINRTDDDLSQWLRNPDNGESLFAFLMKLHEDVEKLGISSFFIEKDYSAFIYLLGLMITNTKVEQPNFRTNLDNLYYSYQSTYRDGIKRDNLSETVSVFNQRIHHLVQTQKEHQFFKTLLSESERKLEEQVNILQSIERDARDDFMVADYFFYAKQLVETYKEKGVHEVYSSSHAAKRFSESIRRFSGSSSVNLNTDSHSDYNFEIISKLARIVLMISNYYVGKVVDTKSKEDLDEIDKYLFVIVWMILHGGENNMFINGRSYEFIKKVFLSLKKDMDV